MKSIERKYWESLLDVIILVILYIATMHSQISVQISIAIIGFFCLLRTTYYLYLFKIKKKKYTLPHANLTNEQKMKIALRALHCYANIDMWHYGEGIPKRHKPYGEGVGDGLKYNAFGIIPDQDGWELAQTALTEMGER